MGIISSEYSHLSLCFRTRCAQRNNMWSRFFTTRIKIIMLIAYIILYYYCILWVIGLLWYNLEDHNRRQQNISVCINVWVIESEYVGLWVSSGKVLYNNNIAIIIILWVLLLLLPLCCCRKKSIFVSGSPILFFLRALWSLSLRPNVMTSSTSS